MDAFQNILLGFAGIALFVSAIFINSTFSIFGALLAIAISFCGIGAGLVPARRAARLDLLPAMATG